MKRSRSWILSFLLGLVTLTVVAGGFTSFQRKRSSFERLDFVSHWESGAFAIDSVDPGSGAEVSGLARGDRILAVGALPADEVDGFKRTLRATGDAVPLLIRRGEQTLIISYRAPELKIDYAYLILTFIGFLYLAIGLFTLFRGGKSDSFLFFFVTLLAFVVYVYSPAGKMNSTFRALVLVEEFARIFLPPLTLHFFLRFPRPLVASKWKIALLYVPPLFLAAWNINLLLMGNAIPLASPETSFRVIDRWEMTHFAIYFTLAFVALAYTYRTAPVVGQRQQIKWIYLGMGLGFVPFLLLYLVPFVVRGEVGDGLLATIAVLPLAFIPLAFAVSILRYKLWDVEVVIKEVLAYTITFVFGMVAFGTVNLLLSNMLEERLTIERNFLAFTSGLLIAGVLVPLKGRIESMMDMLLYRETWKHRRAVLAFAKELATFRDLEELIEIIRDRLAAAIHLHQMNLYLQDRGTFVAHRAEVGLPRTISDGDVPALTSDRPWVLDSPRLPDLEPLSAVFLRCGYRYLFALRHRGELQGLLLLGNKRGQEPLSSDDLQLISSITGPLALAIENARLYGRLRRQLDEIRTLKEYNEHIIESSSSAIVVVAPDGTVLTANHAFWDLVGVGPETQERLQELIPSFETKLRPGAGAVERTLVNRRGETRELSITISEFDAPDAPAGTLVVVIGDITERVRLERELQEKDRLAALGLLAAGIAHEVNTPLTGIASYAQLLLADTPADDPRHLVLRKMEQQSFRASHLVNNLLNFAARPSLAREAVSVEDVVTATIALHEDHFAGKRIHVHRGEPARDATILGNFSEMQQVLTNLLLNAKDAVAEGGNIWIEVTNHEGRVTLIVRDDGPGIAPEVADRIFQPLVTTKRSRGGTGLGLAISRRIVESCGGTIFAANAVDGGAVFTVCFPAWQGSLKPAMIE